MRRGLGIAGFSLSEAVAVITLVGILSVVAFIGLLSTIETYRINSASAKILADLRYAQQQARVHSQWVGVEFQADPANTYHVYTTTGAVDTDVANPHNPAVAFVVDVHGDYDTHISAVDISSGNKVEFSPNGTPYLDKSGAALAATGTVSLACGSRSQVVQIFKGTGRAELQ